ncbi:polyamine aminopropyltransferase [Pendulispora albinea]|uniref:Polyamine aminopropyltransferase n=1 Tax=Pendulispora albinea TaxID=2741071 RepID=A0ABZ2LKC3_9BACT
MSLPRPNPPAEGEGEPALPDVSPEGEPALPNVSPKGESALPNTSSGGEAAHPDVSSGDERDERDEGDGAPKPWLLFATVLVIATAGIVYELVAGAVASYVLGDSITQFSIVIGVYLSALGLGSYLSRFIDTRLARAFVEVEFSTALAGGASAPVLFLAYAHTKAFPVVLYATVTVVGTLVGLELPLLIRILRERVVIKELIARALAFDYLGALVGSLLFSLLLVPRLGLVRTSLAFGLLNAVVGIASTWFVGKSAEMRGARVRGFIVAALLLGAFTQAERITTAAEDQIYADEVIFAKQTAYQRIVMTRSQHSFQLFLNGNLQFASADEYRYHEALVHPAFAVADRRAHVLIAGGGDGLAAREILRYPEVEDITLVDIDPAMTEMASTVRLVRELNGGSLVDPKMNIVHEDAMVWLSEGAADKRFDVIVVDFPDPNNFALGKLYTTRFYHLVQRRLAPGGALVVQATSPLFARISFWCIAKTIEAAGFSAKPYHAAVPSFGEWGFVLAKREAFDAPQRPRLEGLRFLDEASMKALFVLNPDMAEEKNVEVNRLNNQILVSYYEHEWRRWN